MGEQNIISVAKPDMGAEDFAFLTRERMGAYVFVGISKDLKNPTLHHSSTFCWEDENLKVLMQGDSMMALEFLILKNMNLKIHKKFTLHRYNCEIYFLI